MTNGKHIAVSYLCLFALLPPLQAHAQKILSPRDSVVLAFDTSLVSVNYSRPSMRGRRIMGELVPWNKVWRTGANQATHLRTTFDMTLGGTPVPRGAYTLWTLPSPTGWTMIINKQVGQWGTQYDERQDLARFRATTRRLSTPIDTFTVVLHKTGKASGVLKLMWERTSVEVPFTQEKKLGLLSPLDSATVRLKSKQVVIRYSRPSMRGRTVWGVVVPWDTVWRTGANLATELQTDLDIMLGTIRIPRGSYTLYSIPSPKAFTLIVSKSPGGALPQHISSLDLGRTPMVLRRSHSPIDPFRIWFQARGRGEAVLNLGWADRVYSLSLTAP